MFRGQGYQGVCSGGHTARHRESARRASRHSEMPVNLLNGGRSDFRDFSERALINSANHLDFDSAIPGLDSLTPQPARNIVDEAVI